MGVPKFYRWISERYPCLSEVVKEHQVGERGAMAPKAEDPRLRGPLHPGAAAFGPPLSPRRLDDKWHREGDGRFEDARMSRKEPRTQVACVWTEPLGSRPLWQLLLRLVLPRFRNEVLGKNAFTVLPFPLGDLQVAFFLQRLRSWGGCPRRFPHPTQSGRPTYKQ